MTRRERYRQSLLWAIHHWMLEHPDVMMRSARRSHTWFFAFLLVSWLPLTGFAQAEVQTAALPTDKKISAPSKVSVQKSVKAVEAKKDEKKIEKNVKGVVMFIKRDRMSVEMNVDDDKPGQDILLSLDKKLKLKDTNEFSKIRQGDFVEVQYTETYIPAEKKNEKPVIVSRVGTRIALLKSAKPVTGESLRTVEGML